MCMTVPTEHERSTDCWHAYILKPMGPHDFMISHLSDNMITHTHTHTHDCGSRCVSCFFWNPSNVWLEHRPVRTRHGAGGWGWGGGGSVAFSVFLLDCELGRAAYIMSFHQVEQSCGSDTGGFMPRWWET